MKFFRRFSIVFLTIFALAYASYKVYQFGNFVEDMGDCGMSVGPCQGLSIKLDIKHIMADKYVNCPNGKIGFLHTKDNKIPIMFKIGMDKKLKWAYQLETDSCCGIPMRKISINGNTFLENDKPKQINIFNDTYSEPGVIYFTNDFDFEYLCLSPF